MSSLSNSIDFLNEDEALHRGTERVPGAGRNDPDGMPSQIIRFTRPVRAAEGLSPTSQLASPLEAALPGQQAANQFMEAQPPIVIFPKPEFSTASRSELLQQWEGTVVEVDKARMKVTLRSLTSPESPEEHAMIELDEVPDADLPLVDVGAVFYWSIGYRVEPHGQKRTESSIRFRRLPAWTSTEIERASRLASKFDDLFRK